MKTTLMIVLLTFAKIAFSDECLKYHLHGSVHLENGKLTMLVAKGSLSERKLTIHPLVSLQLAPYLEKVVEGTFIIKSGAVLEATELKLSLTDPLNPINDVQKISSSKCPDFKIAP